MATTSGIVPLLQVDRGEPSARAGALPINTISPAILPYLVSIADGHRMLDPMQLSLFRSYCSETRKTNSVTQDGRLELHAFLSFMVSPVSNATKSIDKYDLSYPISSYFISSSHNTYLSGNQLYGESSTDAYRNVHNM